LVRYLILGGCDMIVIVIGFSITYIIAHFVKNK
jgi:hypothetical protein